MQNFIPLHKPFFNDKEVKYASEAIHSGKIAGGGPFGKRLEALLAEHLGCPHVLLVNSCTSALEMAMMALGVGNGDEVICPSFCFVSAANAVLRCGAKPVFCEIEERTLNIDVAHVETLLTNRTRAIIPVHYAGISCDIDGLMNLASKHGFSVVEDAAQALGTTYRERHLGTIGTAGCFSLHETKNVTCGEGGIFVTSDDAVAERAEIIREKGTNRSAFMRGEVDKYTWVHQGSSYIVSDILAAIALAQFEKLDEITKRRSQIAEYYIQELIDVADRVVLPTIPEDCIPNWHIFAVRIGRDHRDTVIQKLRERDIGASFHFVPLHNAPFNLKELGCSDLHLPVTDRIASEIIRLPIFPQLTEADLRYIVTTFKDILLNLNST